jgi:hypothetical protein
MSHTSASHEVPRTGLICSIASRGQFPPPIRSTSFNVTGSDAVSCNWIGVDSEAHCSAAVSSGVMHVDQSDSETWITSSDSTLQLSNKPIFSDGFDEFFSRT